MLEESYQSAFFDCIKGLDPVAIGLICCKHKIDTDSFIKWISADPVRLAKMNEVTDARIAQWERQKKAPNNK